MLQWLGLCPIVKRIWTSSYTLYSGGLVVLMLAAFYAAIEMARLEAVVVPVPRDRRELDRDLRHELDDRALRDRRAVRHGGAAPFAILGAPFEPVLRGAAVLVVFWSILYWMYRRRIFLRI